MATIVLALADLYHKINIDYADPRTKDWYLVGSPFQVLGILAFYHYFIYRLGPEIMKNRAPYNLDRIIQIYNIFQVVASVYMCIIPTYIVFGGGHFNIACQEIDYSLNPIAVRIARWCWMYYMLKVIDLLDTVFFVLRKKYNQVSVLHVYHHTGMVLAGYMATKYITGGQTAFVAVINSLVHAVMYSYYFITNVNPEYKKNIWWKKYITQLQMVQFLLIIIHTSLVLFQPTCNFPRWVVYAFIPQNVVMLVLFSDFYRKNYLTSKNKTHQQENGKPSLKKE